LSADLIPNKAFFDTYNEAVLIFSDKQQVIYINPAFTYLTGFGLQHPFEMQALSELLIPDTFEADGLFKNRAYLSFSKKDGALLKAKVSESDIVLSDQSKGKFYTFNLLPGLDVITGGERKFYELADASPAMIFLQDENEQAFYFNKSWLTYTGKTLKQQQNLLWKNLVHPDDIRILEDLAPTITRRKSYSFELRLKKFDGSYRNIFVINTPLLSEDRAFAGYMSSGLDITEVKEAQNQISQLSHALKQSTEELNQFTYVTSHDLQEPLRMITGYIQLIQKNIERGNLANLDEFMGFVLGGASRMQMLIADLLHLSRVTRKTAPFAAVNINDVIHVALSHLSKAVTAGKAEITCENMPTIMGDTYQLVSLFENLLENALKFRTLDTLSKITISAGQKDDKYIFQIKDNGIGIDYKFHKRIFAIFQRLHTQAEYEGTGIGLAVCKKIVERHGGEIWVESEPGKGSAFYFSIKNNS
jgi:PAS domain S-box-containing protein